MQYRYGEYDGSPFPTPDDLFPQPKVVQFILQYGQRALDALEEMGDEEQQDLIEQMIAAGLLERDEATGQLRLTPRMVRGIEHRAMLEIFEGLARGSREGHQTIATGSSDDRTEGTKPYDYGDPVSELDLAATMRNALHRQLTERQAAAEAQAGAAGAEIDPGAIRPTLPLHINSHDFELHLTEGQSDVALCILIDLSGSMMRYGRFYQAKRVALGMASLVRQRFPQDTVDYVGFYSTACPIRESELPLIMPKPVTIHDYQVRMRVPLEQALANPRRVPQHFTNLQMGLRLARQALARRGAANKQIFIITDGQPTAHIEPAGAAGSSSASSGLISGSGGGGAGGGAGGDAGEMLYLLYPPTEHTSTITLKEALRCQQQGIRIATFALIEDYWGMEWVGFVDQLTRLTRGVAFYCTSEDLSSTVIESYLSGKRRKSFVG